MRHRPLITADAGRVEGLLGLERFSVRGVERSADGDFVILFRTQRVGDRWPRVLRISTKRVVGYQPHSSQVRQCDVRAWRRASERRFAWWLSARLGFDALVVHRAIFERDLAAVEELRELLLTLARPDSVIAVWAGPRLRPPRQRIPDHVPEEWP